MATKTVRKRRTMAANPKKRKRKPAMRKTSKRSRSKALAHSSSRSVAKRSRRRRRNPSVKSMIVAGVPVIETAAGAAATIALSQAVEAMPWAIKFKAENAKAGALLGPAVAGAAGWALTQYVKNPMAKKMGTSMVTFAIFKAVDGVAGASIKKMVANFGKKSGDAGGYVLTGDAGGYGFTDDAVQGLYLQNQVGGAHVVEPSQAYHGGAGF